MPHAVPVTYVRWLNANGLRTPLIDIMLSLATQAQGHMGTSSQDFLPARRQAPLVLTMKALKLPWSRCYGGSAAAGSARQPARGDEILWSG